MLAVNRILVPVDFSEYSKFLVEQALSFAACSQAEVVVLHVWPQPLNPAGELGRRMPAMGHLDQTDLSLRAAEKQLEVLLARVEVGDGDILSTRLIPGLPWQAIIEQARSDHFDLIVMGTHGHAGPSQLFLGSVAEKVMRHSPCPVLTVPWASMRQEQDLQHFF